MDQSVSSITDTLGRVIHFDYAGSQLQSITQLVQPSAIDPSGTHTYATFSWASIYASGQTWYKFANNVMVIAPPLTTAVNALTGCTYANGTGYRFSYGDWGIIKKIEKLNAASPQQQTVSYISYNFPAASAGALGSAPAYTQQTVSPDGGTGNLSVWNYGFNITSFGVVTSEVITDPDQNVTTINLNPDGSTSSTTFKDAQKNAIVRTVNYTWKSVGASLLPDQVTTVLNDITPAQQSSVRYFYDPYGNVTDLYERDFSGTILRHTVTSFKGGDFITHHILNLPATVYVKDGSDNPISRTDFGYDDFGFTTSIGGLATHDDNVGTVRGNLTSVTRYLSPGASAPQVSMIVARSYHYDSLGNLRTADLDCCNQKTFNFSALTQYSYPDSVIRGTTPQFTSSFTYNFDNGLLLSSTDENAQVTQYQYDVMYRPTITTAPPSNNQTVQSTTSYADNIFPLTITTSSTVDSAVGVQSFDGLGRLTGVDLKNGTLPVNSTTFSYNAMNRRIHVSNPFAPGETPVFTTYGYDGLGRVTSVAPPTAGSTQISYAGNATTVTDPAGKQQKNYVDPAGRLVRVDEPGLGFNGTAASGTLPVNGTLQNAGTHSSGSITVSGSEGSITDWNNCYFLSNGLEVCDQIYNQGSVTVTINGFNVSAGYGQGSTQASIATALRNGFNVAASPVTASLSGSTVSFVSKAVGSGVNYSISCSSTYDDFDFPGPSFTAACPASLTGGQDVADAGTVYVNINGFAASAPYGQPGNNTAALVASALASSGPTGLNRSGSPVQAQASGAGLIITYNSVGTGGNVAVSLTSTTSQTAYFSTGSFAGSVVLGGGQDPYLSGLEHPYITTYTYDVMDRLTGVSQAAGIENGVSKPGQSRSYSYDAIGRLYQSITPESGTLTNYYADSSNAPCSGNPMLICRTLDARGVTKSFSYDGINRISGVTYTNDPAGTAAVTYQYDAGGQAAFALDRLTKITEGANNQTFTYDNRGRITSANQVIDGVPYPLSYGYNKADQVTSITYPTGRIVSQNFDVIGRMQSIASAGTTYLTVNTWNSAMQPTAVTYGNQVLGASHFNDHLQIDTLRYYKSGAASDLLNLSYDYTTGVPGNNGQIQAIHYYTSPGVEDPTRSEYFTYDNWSRLSAAHTGTVSSTPGTWSLAWSYDRLGNRLSQTRTGGNVSIGQPQFTVDQNTNQITNSGYAYVGGNMTHDATAAYAYDGANRLISANNGSTPGSYSYFGALRIKKIVGGATTVSVYSGSKPIAEYVNGSLSREHIYSGSSLLATIIAGAATYHYPDHLSNRVEADSSGTPVRTYGHFPFGETWYETGPADKWKFTSYERDSGTGETGLDYAMFRHYSSGLGRFMSADLLAGRLTVPQSLNRYSYVLNNAANVSDPLGLCDAGWYFDEATESYVCVGVGIEVGTAGGGGSHASLEAPPQGGEGTGGDDKKAKIESLRSRLWSALLNDPECLNFLMGKSGGALGVLDTVPIDIQNIGSAGLQAKTTFKLEPPSLAPIDPAIHINSNGLFFVQGLGTTMGGTLVKTGTPLFQAEVLLHELGHATGALPDDSQSDNTSHENNDRVMEKCKRALSNFKNN